MKIICDENASMYHLVNAIRKKKSKRLEALHTAEGEVLTTQDEISAHAQAHFEEKFRLAEDPFQEDILDEVPLKVSQADNIAMLQPVSGEELFKALHRSKPKKPPGPGWGGRNSH